MTDRNATSATLAAIAGSQSSPCHLVEVYRDAGTTYLTDAFRSVTWNGNTYTSQGHLLDFDGIAETLDLQAHRVSVSLSGDDDPQTWIAAALGEQWIGRRIVIRKAFLNESSGVIIDPISLFDGFVDDIDIGDEIAPDRGTTKVILHAASEFADFERLPGRHTNDNEQQQLFPGDKFFEHVTGHTQTISWGGRTVSEAYNERLRQKEAAEYKGPSDDHG